MPKYKFSLITYMIKHSLSVLFILLTAISIISFIHFSQNGLSLAYNDARSHLDIGRRVVEGLKPGLAQLGSVWLPLPHILMIPTIWLDFMWHTGLSGSIQSMLSFVISGLIIYKFLERLNISLVGRLTAVFIFASNINILYLQSTAMTELLLIATMSAASLYLLKWYQTNNLLDLIACAFFVMLSTLTRYDGWFLLLIISFLVFVKGLSSKKYSQAEGLSLTFGTLAAFGVLLWFLWNLLIFKDPLYFAFGHFSAYTQQNQLQEAGNLATKGNLALSTKIYLFSLFYNSYTLIPIIALIGLAMFLFCKDIPSYLKLATLSLLTPLAFNIIALYFGHSVLFVQGLSGNTWFNVRYGIMLMPAICIFIGFLIDKLPHYKSTIIGLLLFVTIFSYANYDAVTIDDATVGSSQKNVTEVASYLQQNATKEKGFILISAASHDAIIFSSHLPMKRFIHEGTGAYWESATIAPDRWARWIIMRTSDNSDLTWKLVSASKGFSKYNLVNHYPFADIYEIKTEFLPQLQTDAVFTNQR